MAFEKYPNNSRWLTDDTFQLIEIVRDCESLYNPQNKHYFCRPVVENMWKDIDRKLGKRPGASLAKWTNLRICFRREYSSSLKNEVKNSWTFFDKMLFLHPFLRKKRTSTEGMEINIQEALEQISSITRGNFKNFVENIEPCEPGGPNETHAVEVEEDGIWNENMLIKTDESNQCFEIDTVGSNDIGIVSGKSNSTKNKIRTENLHLKRAINDHIQMSSLKTYMVDAKKVKMEDLAQTELLSTNEAIDLSDSTTHHRAHIISAAESDSNLSTQIACECKTNPDAMFLLSLLPDIQSLCRRDKGRFKIEVQRLIQNLLYPDDS